MFLVFGVLGTGVGFRKGRTIVVNSIPFWPKRSEIDLGQNDSPPKTFRSEFRSIPIALIPILDQFCPIPTKVSYFRS